MREVDDEDAEQIAAIVRDQLPGYVLVRDPPDDPSDGPAPDPGPGIAVTVSPPIDVLQAHYAQVARGGGVGPDRAATQAERVGIYRVASTHSDAEASRPMTVVTSLTAGRVISMQG